MLCAIHAETQTTMRIVDIVVEVVEKIVIEEKIVEVPVEMIVREVYVIYKEKVVDLEVIIAEVIQRVQASIPRISQATVHIPTVVAEVVHSVVASTPYTETDEVEHHVSDPKPNREKPTPQPIPQPTPEPVPPPPPPVVDPEPEPEREGGEYVVYRYADPSNQGTGKIHEDYVSWESNGDGTSTMTFLGPNKRKDDGDRTVIVDKVVSGLSDEEASEVVREIL